MTNQNKRIALKPYLETIEEYCSQLSREELIQLMLSLAKDESTAGRMDFLNRLKTLSPCKDIVKTERLDIEALLEDVQALKESIMERIEAIENGNYEELDDWDWEDAHYDDEPEMINEEQIDDLTDLFDKAGYLFLSDEIQSSKSLYQALFDLLNKAFGEYDYYLLEPGIDIREERARYTRSVYDTSDEGQRLDEFANAMNIEASGPFDKQTINNSYPLLQDVMDAGEKEMKDIKVFYPLWEKFLKEKGTQGRPASLLAEVAYLTKGLPGVIKLAQEWGNIQPYGYLFWLDKLRQEKKWDDIIKVAKEALDVLETGQNREKVSDFLMEAGQMANNPDILLEGYQEKFYSHPCDANLKTLLTEAVKQDQRKESLTQLLNFYERQKNDNEQSLHLKILLLAGDLNKPWEIVKDTESLGWSYGFPGGLVFGSICAVAAGYHEDAGTIKELLAWYCDESSISFSIGEEDQADFFRDEILKGLSQTRFQPSGLKTYIDWAFQIGRERIDKIVSNTHRSAYKRAALVLGSLAELYVAQEDAKKAKSLIYEYCKEKYNRHTAFKREVKQMISESIMLRHLGKLI